MAELADFDKEFVDRLGESTAGFIDSVGAAYDGQLPVKTIYVPDDGTIVEKDISWPLPILEFYRDKKSEVFRETARWIEANPERSYRWDGEIFDPSSQDKQPYLDDLVYDPNQEQLIEAFENDLFDLSQEIVKYTGELAWSEKAFKKAAEKWLVNVSFMGPLGPLSEDFKTLIPLINFSSSEEEIELESDVQLVDRFDGEWISHIEVSELTPVEVASIYTQEKSRKIGDKGNFGETSHGIKIQMNGSIYAANDDQIRAAIVTAFRLFRPQTSAIHGDKAYRMTAGPLNHREGILDIRALIKAMSTPMSPHSRETYELDEEEGKDFKKFWSRYKDKMNTKSENNITKSLRRFNEMHRKSNVEDQIIDCAIALEGTLLQDINPGSSLTFRLLLRSGLLLDNVVWDRKTVREIFRAIYSARGDIIHSNSQLEEIINENAQFELFDGRKPAPREFVSISRTLLAQTLLRYIVEEVENGKSVAEVNQEMDAAALNADYP